MEKKEKLIWLVTGASTGLGLALTKRILARGDRVIATARTPSRFASLLPDIDQDRLHVLSLDTTSPYTEIQRTMNEAIARWGRVDVLVNNAGVADNLGPSEEVGSAQFMKLMATNLAGTIDCTNAILPHMRSRRSGTIVIIGSRSGYRTELTGIAAYGASKAAVHAYGESLGAELKPFNIRVTNIVPGTFRTTFNSPSIVQQKFSDYKPFHDTIPLYLGSLMSRTDVGDPVKGMDVVVDIVRGEGRAAEKTSWPQWVVLTEEAIKEVRARLENMGRTIDEWESVGINLGLDVEEGNHSTI